MLRMLVAAGIIFGVVLLWVWIQRKAGTEEPMTEEGSCASCGERAACPKGEQRDSSCSERVKEDREQ